MRINVYIAQQLGISRREADRSIQDKKVTVNGKKAVLGQQIDLATDRIVLNGKIVKEKQQEKITIALYKPKGYITTRSDPKKRKTVMRLLPKELQKLKPVGRLDYESEGLLLLTNDGELIYKSTHPKYKKQKEYRMVFKKAVDKKLIERFGKGLRLSEGIARADSVKQIDKNEIEVIIHQGWNRQLRRMAEICHHEVVKLIRIRVGDVMLENLKPGEWRKVEGPAPTQGRSPDLPSGASG